mmetsp:Transcript_43212/g.115616  ORF Transcript_43212/g.115616 Transcript_43212/m.115616 type:complete len:129 (-) Transcript_43212:572-958(-)
MNGEEKVGTSVNGPVGKERRPHSNPIVPKQAASDMAYEGSRSNGRAAGHFSGADDDITAQRHTPFSASGRAYLDNKFDLTDTSGPLESVSGKETSAAAAAPMSQGQSATKLGFVCTVPGDEWRREGRH